MASFAVESLNHTINCLLIPSYEPTIDSLHFPSRISIKSSSREILESADHGVMTLQLFLLGSEAIRESIESTKALEGGIIEAARKLEDVIESHILDQLLSQSEESRLAAGDVEQQPLSFSVDLQELRQDVDCFAEKAMKMQKLFELFFKEEHDIVSLVKTDCAAPTKKEKNKNKNKNKNKKKNKKKKKKKKITDRAGNESEMVGSSEQNGKIRDQFINECATRAASIFGMKEKYVEEFENLFPEEKDDDDDDAVSSRTDFAGSSSDKDEIVRRLRNWWITKAASILGVEEHEHINELGNTPVPREEVDASSTTAFGGNRFEMVGYSDEFHEIRDHIVRRDEYRIIIVTGMAGIGKTMLAKKILEDPSILRNFECCAFVKVGQKYLPKEILQAILAQLNTDIDKKLMEGDDKELGEYLRETLDSRKYLIVLDDVWNFDVWSYLSEILPYEDNGSRILVTSRIKKLYLGNCFTYHMRFLNKEESWDLLRQSAFAQKVCPPQFEKAGKEIADNCEGLPLLILVVANLLSTAERTPEYWNTVAKDKENSIFQDAYHQILEVLYPSYNYLSQFTKQLFLYMAAFPQNNEVSISRLISLWRAEGYWGFPYVLSENDLQSTIKRRFWELVSNNLVLVRRQSHHSNKIKAGSLHSVFWYLCKKEAQNNKFLQIFNRYSDAFAEGTKSMRCLSIYKNILFGIKDVYNSMASISSARMLLCTGPHHQYQVPMCFNLRLLRVLDALTIHFYEFPVEVLKLIYLRYLALTCNANLPSSISTLWNLQYLIVHQYCSIKSIVAEAYLPAEIWYLQELNYLQTMGRNLPNPPPGVVLHNLRTLLDVGAQSCTKCVLESLPNLKKLRVQMELAPDEVEPPSCFDHISISNKLKSLQCVIVNPNLGSEIVAPHPHLLAFTSSLRKLTLSGLGHSWKDMNKIADLPFLKVLKLRCYAFRGEKWEAQEYRFPNLQYLLIEDTDLVQWTARCETFPNLNCLTIKHCYKLREIPKILSATSIQLVDCNPLALTSAKRMEYECCRVCADSSFLV